MKPQTLALWLVLVGPLPGFAQEGANDHSAGDFPASLVSNTIGLASRDNVLPLLGGAGLVLVARPFDDEMQSALNGEANAVGELGDALGKPILLGSTAGLFVAGQLAPPGRFREVTYDLAQGLVLNVAVVTILKWSVGRQRPDSSNFRSFPSGHSAASFTAAAILQDHFGPRAGVPALLVAGFVAASRIESNKHFLSDVVAGGALGYIVGRTVTATRRRARKADSRNLSVNPFPTPGGVGVLVGLVF